MSRSSQKRLGLSGAGLYRLVEDLVSGGVMGGICKHEKYRPAPLCGDEEREQLREKITEYVMLELAEAGLLDVEP